MSKLLRIVSVQTLNNQVLSNSFVVLGAYSFIGILYLVVAPLFLYFWMNSRWHHMGKIERLSVYGLVFLFFPGMILFSPFLNLRLQGQGED